MNNLWVIASGAGLQDGLNPCIFMTCAIFIAHGIWLKKNSLRLVWFRLIFVLVYALSFINFNFGGGQVFILRKEFIFAAKILYFILGAGAFIAGVIFLKDWFLIRPGTVASNQPDKEIKPPIGKWLLFRFVTVIIAVALSAMCTLAPINNYFLILGNEILLKKLWPTAISVLGGYVFFNMWPLWLVWAFLSIKNLRPSLLKIVCASIFFTASSCMILIFK